MRHLLVLFLGILFLTSCGRHVKKQSHDVTSRIQVDSLTNSDIKSKIRFDGLYQENADTLASSGSDSSEYSTAKHYIRFFNNGQVMTVTSTGTPIDLKRWFNRECKNCSIGQFEITGQKIHFISESQYGKVIYDGIVYGNYELDLKVKSLINGHQSRNKYHFVQITDWTE